MKLRIFRIIVAILLTFLSLIGIFLAVFNIILANNGTRQDSSYLILLISFFIGSLFLGFETFFVIRSFKEGTIILHQICIVDKGYTKRKATLIIASVLALVGIGLIIFNSLIVIVYYLFIVQDDIEIAG